MYLVRQDFQSNHFGTIPRSSLIYQLQKAFGDFSHENFTAIFGTPNDVIFAAVHDMVIGLVSQHHGERCTSSLSLCQQITMSLISPCLKAGALRLRLVVEGNTLSIQELPGHFHSIDTSEGRERRRFRTVEEKRRITHFGQFAQETKILLISSHHALEQAAHLARLCGDRNLFPKSEIGKQLVPTIKLLHPE